VQDLLAGVTDMSITTLGAVRPHFQAGKLRPLATTGDKRAASLPDVPTLAEQGSRPIRPIRGGASMRRPARRSRSSSACTPSWRRP
jgi:tripartite-type tricarboxylate transporter receptor subunit TctC